jgi:hypothetical protein
MEIGKSLGLNENTIDQMKISYQNLWNAVKLNKISREGIVP